MFRFFYMYPAVSERKSDIKHPVWYMYWSLTARSVVSRMPIVRIAFEMRQVRYLCVVTSRAAQEPNITISKGGGEIRGRDGTRETGWGGKPAVMGCVATYQPSGNHTHAQSPQHSST